MKSNDKHSANLTIKNDNKTAKKEKKEKDQGAMPFASINIIENRIYLNRLELQRRILVKLLDLESKKVDQG